MQENKKVQSILVSRLRFMGDIILTTPLLKALRDKYPSAKITYLAEMPHLALLENHPWIDRHMPVSLGWKSQSRLVSDLIGNRFDVAIDLFGNPRSALLAWLCGASMRIGGNFRGRRHFYTHRIITPEQPLNAIQYHMRYVEPLEIPSAYADPFIQITEGEKAWAKDYLTRRHYDPTQLLIGIHTGATWPAKRWFPERFADLARRIKSEKNAQIYFTCGPGEEMLVQSVIEKSGIRSNKPEILPLRKLGAILSQMDCFISNDCGPMHLAPAVGTKTIGIFGPGEPEIWFPYRLELGHRFVHHTIDCSRCHRDLCEKLDCMKAISVDDVMQAVDESLSVNPVSLD